MKTIDEYFADWESDTFGLGYGTGEPHILGALKDFFEAFDDEGKYDYRELENSVGAPVAWLLITAMIQADVIEYGTSPRFGWVTHPHGKALFDFFRTHTADELVALTDREPEEYPCMPDWCNCPDPDCRNGNPFWNVNRIPPLGAEKP